MVNHVSVALLIAASASLILTACDPGYGFKVQNDCDRAVEVDFLSDQEDIRNARSGPLTETPATVGPGVETSFAVGYDGSPGPYGLRLHNGPRKGHVIQNDEPSVVIPANACPQNGSEAGDP